MRILVTICTRARPKMLEACLRSVTAQQVPEGVTCDIAVIENDAALHCIPIVDAVAAETGRVIHTVLEPELGLPFARNRCGTFAVEQGYDWALYIDDDEVATPGWLETLVAAARRDPADVYYARVVSVFPEGTPPWMALPEVNKRPTGTVLTKAEGHNTMVHRRIFAADGLNLRFDTALRFTGGSDTDFFSRVHKAGGRIIWVGEAVVEETVPASRMNLRWQLNRTFRVAINISVLHEKQRGKAASSWRSLAKGTGRLLGGILQVPAGLALSLVVPLKGRILAFKAAKQIASGLGSFAYLLGIRPEPYRKVDGG
ncbi:MAG: glycosyltransferase [Beijerinckiaceae bacterium]|nr:glycosyltransferase [Beijerinckiaceae bacterium]